VRRFVVAGGLAIAARVGRRRLVGIVAALGVILVLGLLPGSASASTGWNGFTWTEVGSQNTVTFTITDSVPTQSWKSFFFQADGTPANSIQATGITVTVGSTIDTTDCTEQTGTNALQIGCQGFASGFLGAGKTVTLSWLASPQIQANVGGYFGGTDSANQSTAGDVTGPTIQFPVCDWTVTYVDPQRYVRSLPVDYRVRIANAGDAACAPAQLTIKEPVKSNLSYVQPIGKLENDPSSVAIPGLEPGGSDTAQYALVGKQGLYSYIWSDIEKQGSLGADLQAEMPFDDDQKPRDESGNTSIKLLPELVTFAWKHLQFDTRCPTDVENGFCYEHFVIIFRQQPASERRYAATRNHFLVVGSARGKIKAGRTGQIHLKLNAAGRELLSKRHKVPVTLIGTRKQGSKTTLLKGHVKLH
jgi:hypothetical protein